MIGAVLGGVIIWVKTSTTRHVDKERAYEKAVKSLIHDAFFGRSKEILNGQELTLDVIENYEQLYDSYRELGMNGTGETLYQQVKEIRVKTK